MQITSSVFDNNEPIPEEYTCEGMDTNPPLIFKDIPEQTKRLVLVVEDPDAPGKTWVHWLVYDMPVIEQIEQATTPPGKQGTNDFRKLEYGGPCPPSGKHRYYFKLFALNKEVGLEEGKRKAEVEQAMQGHIITQSELIGTYAR
jgi:hypothetical protein